ncbi:MAG: hypothetical protein K2R98_23710 [Gemmataceae bacterium]|nr:hypothetical protein [Gemmataceae bacterium]
MIPQTCTDCGAPPYGGSGKDPVWGLCLDHLGVDLRFRQDSQVHGLIEPEHAMTLDEFQQAIAATKPYWKKP